jgi:methylmalonyl-CoA mutase
MTEKKLFKAFPEITDKEWKEKILKDLKGGDFSKLIWKTNEGFNVEPYYRENDNQKLSHINVLPGNFPFVRGKNKTGNNWLVRQNIKVNNIDDANKKALNIRLKGVDSIGFILNDDIIPDQENIEKLTENIRADLMELNFVTKDPLLALRSVDELAKKYSRDLEKVKGSVCYDPIGYLTRFGKFNKSENDDMGLLIDLHKGIEHLPNFHYLVIDATIFKNSGSGIVNEMAFALAKGAEYLTFLTSNGFDIDDITPHIRFNFAVGSDYFMEIAKFRAVKYLWSKIVNAYGLNDADNAKIFIHCTNSNWNKTVYDPYVNMLRTTTETMSAVIGGIDSMTVLPFNAIFEEETEFSERIARNQQLILKGESYFDKVGDIGAGSYYIEQLTDKLIHSAWEQFLKIDENDGYIKAFRKGIIQDIIKAESEIKDHEIAIRKRSLLGTNQFPNTGEHIDKKLKAETDSEQKPDVEPLHVYRGGEELEFLRNNTDVYSLENKRPEVWMFTYGNLAMRKARSQFAGNFFGCAGYEIVDNPGFKTVSDGVEAALKAKPEILVICSSDDEYKDAAIEIYNQLKNDTIVVLAGYPKDQIEDMKKAGLDNFIHIRSNLLEELTRYNQLLKIS